MGDIGERQVRFEVLPAAPGPDQAEPAAATRDVADPQPAPTRAEPVSR